MIRAGKLRETITVMRAHETRNDAGSKVTTWTAHATTRAELVSTAYGDAADESGPSDTETVVFRLRALALTPADRIHHAGRVLNIKAIREIAQRRGLELQMPIPGEGHEGIGNDEKNDGAHV